MSTSPAPHLNGTRSSHHSPYNATYFTDEDMDEIGFTDVQTVVMACSFTLVLLVLVLVSYVGIRFCWARLKRNQEASEFGKGLDKEASTDRNKSSHVLLPDQMKPSESQFSVIPVEEIDEALTSYSSGNHTSKSTANGSIITMTMKNNHLIVETEERIAEGSGEGNGVFVVDLENNKGTPGAGVPASEAIIHQTQDDPFDDDIMGPSTGLSQSDLSASSNGSNNPTYSYGNQQEYVADVVAVLSPVQGAPKRSATIAAYQDDDDIYLEQQRQLGNGVDRTLDETSRPQLGVQTSVCSTVDPVYENPGFVTIPDPCVDAKVSS